MKERIEWIDGLRGVAMIFVVFHHSISGMEEGWMLNVFIGPIMIPLFFSISGYLFNNYDGNIKKFLINLFRKLVFPWFFLSLIWVRAILIPFRGVSYWIGNLKGLISGDMLWYMPACILAEFIFFFIKKFFRNSILNFGVIVACMLFGFTLNYYGIGNFAMFNRALIAQFFLFLGNYFKKYMIQVKNISYVQNGFLIVIYTICGSFLIWRMPMQYIDVHWNKYPNGFICFFMISSGCLVLFSIMAKLVHVPKWLVWVGRNTLVCYIFHGYVLTAFNKVYSLGIIEKRLSLAIGETIIAIIICGILAMPLNKYLPATVGRKRTKRCE